MLPRCVLLLALTPLAFAQFSPQIRSAAIPDSELESAHQADPDNMVLSSHLLAYYSTGQRDPNWSSRFALLSATIAAHPEADFLSQAQTYANMPQAFVPQIRQMWIAQVHQHPDDPRILRNAATGLEPPVMRIRVGGGVQSANLLRKVTPAYPALARQAHIQGTVRYNATISPEGLIQNLELVSGHPLLVAAATQAAELWVYRPTLLNGRPVTVITTIDIDFSLADAPPAAGQLNPSDGVKLQ